MYNDGTRSARGIGCCTAVRSVSRSSNISGTRLLGSTLAPEAIMADVGLLDDAAASGGTFRTVADTVERAGGHAAHFAVCASTRAARESLQRRRRDARWSAAVNNLWQVLYIDQSVRYAISGDWPAISRHDP